MTPNTAFIAGQLLGDVFGISSPIYIPWFNSRQPFKVVPGYEGVQLSEQETSEVLSWMGTPVLGSFKLDGKAYKTYDNKGKLITMEQNDFVMPFATVVEFNRAMNVTKTKTLGNKGTVKEIYGLDDWSISIRGICLTDENRNQQKTASEQYLEMCSWRDVCDTVNVTGEIFNEKGIYGLVFDSFSLRPVQGKPDVMAFEIQATSDNPIELML